MSKIKIGLLIIFVCAVVAVSGCMASPLKLVISYPGSWNGTITTDSSGTQNIEGTGDETIELGSMTGGLTVHVEKQEPSNDTLKLSLIRGDETIQEGSSAVESTGGELDDAWISVYLTP
ncbi:hypothetical protein [Methanobacterium petrolearium]|uniref:hypothetical protein n=1 Tax=Methanobacterium petrolearium TaxID=710190 RepID=UPI001AE3FD58|nr:hypothetical protein [Methanobacterium petrolearium]MBP1946121.1 2-methylaconitate cis-trans-isomerase PrpF [Methanobacterium petrolearium]BDZ70736.1 hypothetical protein GCM10025861_12530 [Methanobacterium petrolearium]